MAACTGKSLRLQQNPRLRHENTLNQKPCANQSSDVYSLGTWWGAMQTISVVIPFYQCETGVLARTLLSIEAQVIPTGWRLQAVLVDDGSPLPARHEIKGVDLTAPRFLKVVEQANKGVGAARNHGLDIAIPESAAIAFLDSDDIWPAGHIARAIAALEAGFDFYFTDNRRDKSHESHIRSRYSARTAQLIDQTGQTSGLVELPQDKIVGFCLQEFPCQASTIVYRASVAPLLRFPTHLKYSGEDVLFMTELLARSTRVGFDHDGMVECGDGVNIYFKNLAWDAPRFLNIKVDQMLTYRALAKADFLSTSNKALSRDLLEIATSQLSFHVIRTLVKNPKKAVGQLWRLFTTDIGAGAKVLVATPKTIFAKLLGRAVPVEVD
jgi:succinoglycan biosynthesis protein ExoW